MLDLLPRRVPLPPRSLGKPGVNLINRQAQSQASLPDALADYIALPGLGAKPPTEFMCSVLIRTNFFHLASV